MFYDSIQYISLFNSLQQKMFSSSKWIWRPVRHVRFQRKFTADMCISVKCSAWLKSSEKNIRFTIFFFFMNRKICVDPDGNSLGYTVQRNDTLSDGMDCSKYPGLSFMVGGWDFFDITSLHIISSRNVES
jgi:hypothetical protein